MHVLLWLASVTRQSGLISFAPNRPFCSICCPSHGCSFRMNQIQSPSSGILVVTTTLVNENQNDDVDVDDDDGSAMDHAHLNEGNDKIHCDVDPNDATNCDAIVKPNPIFLDRIR